MYNEKGILWKSILEIQGIPLIVIPYRYGVLTNEVSQRQLKELQKYMRDLNIASKELFEKYGREVQQTSNN